MPGHWEVTVIYVPIKGKALFFRSISEQQHEVRNEFQQVPGEPDPTFACMQQSISPTSACSCTSHPHMRPAQLLYRPAERLWCHF